MKLTRKSTMLAVLFGTVILIPVALPSLAAWSPRQSSNALSNYKTNIAIPGARRIRLATGDLAEGRRKLYSVPMKLNKPYEFLAIGDQNCDALQVRLLDSQGQQAEIASGPNTLTGATGATAIGQVLSYTPTSDTNFTLEVFMEGCASDEACSFAVGQYTR